MKIKIAVFLLSLAAVLFGDICEITPEIHRDGEGTVVRLAFKVSEGAYLYQDSISAEFQGKVPEYEYRFLGTAVPDKDGAGNIIKQDFALEYRFNQPLPLPAEVIAGYQGCQENLCLLPVSKTLLIGGGNTAETSPAEQAGELDGFKTAGTAAGYMKPSAFIGWIDSVREGRGDGSINPLTRFFAAYGFLAGLLLLIPLGIALNFTPCILPMIPINLAIIGAGEKRSGMLGGLRKGGLYGLGTALAYGILGFAAVRTGAVFGSVNSSAWFNFAVSGVFILLSLGMFDVLRIDFTSWRRQRSWGGAAGIFLLGAMSALLSGACVAPVLIWVLLLAADIYASGSSAGLFMPFMLGIGMGLPWPLLGAGLGKLPLPGPWMQKVRTAIGVFILFFAVYYGWIAVRLIGAQDSGHNRPGWYVSAQEGLAEAKERNTPVLLEFWGFSCKSCSLMDKTTLRNADVRNRLEGFTKISVRGDDVKSAESRRLVEALQIKGVPSYVILIPEQQ